MSIDKEFNKPIKGLKVTTSERVFKKQGRRYCYKDTDKVYGRVDKQIPGFILSKNRSRFIFQEDMVKMPKKNKQEILNKLYDPKNSKRRVLYIVDSRYDTSIDPSLFKDKKGGNNGNQKKK